MRQMPPSHIPAGSASFLQENFPKMIGDDDHDGNDVMVMDLGGDGVFNYMYLFCAS